MRERLARTGRLGHIKGEAHQLKKWTDAKAEKLGQLQQWRLQVYKTEMKVKIVCRKQDKKGSLSCGRLH